MSLNLSFKPMKNWLPHCQTYIHHSARLNFLTLLALFTLSTLNSQLSTFAQGSLTPPGPPAPTMKTLPKVEPRTPISPTPFSISAPGFYSVTANLTGVPFNYGITISANDISLDLNGFALIGVANSYSGVGLSGLCTNLHIFNGVVRNWGNHGLSLGSGFHVRLEGLSVCQNAIAGVILNYGTIQNCTVAENGNDGIRLYDRCLAINNFISGNASYGIFVSFNNNQIESNQLQANGNYGIYNTGANTLIIKNTARGHTSTNYSFSAFPIFGPIISTTGTITTNNPWANFSY